MLENIAYFQIFGQTIMLYSGVIALLAFIFAASVALLNKRGIRIIPFRWHPRVAAIAIIFALIHGALGIFLLFK